MLRPSAVDGTAMAASSGAQLSGRNPRYRCLRVQERAQLPAPVSRNAQLVSSPGRVAVGPAGQRDAGPLHPQRPGVGLPVGRVVQHRQARGGTGPPPPTLAGPGSVAPPLTGWADAASRRHPAPTLRRGARRGCKSRYGSIRSMQPMSEMTCGGDHSLRGFC